MRGSEYILSVVTQEFMYISHRINNAYTSRTYAHTGVLHELSGNVPVIPVQGFDVG